MKGIYSIYLYHSPSNWAFSAHGLLSYPLPLTFKHVIPTHTHCLSHSSMSYPLPLTFKHVIPTASHIRACHTHCLSHSSMSYPLIPTASHIQACHTHCLSHSSMSYPLPLTFKHVIPTASHIRACHTHCLSHSSTELRGLYGKRVASIPCAQLQYNQILIAMVNRAADGGLATSHTICVYGELMFSEVGAWYGWRCTISKSGCHLPLRPLPPR